MDRRAAARRRDQCLPNTTKSCLVGFERHHSIFHMLAVSNALKSMLSCSGISLTLTRQCPMKGRRCAEASAWLDKREVSLRVLSIRMACREWRQLNIGALCVACSCSSEMVPKAVFCLVRQGRGRPLPKLPVQTVGAWTGGTESQTRGAPAARCHSFAPGAMAP